MPGRRLKDLLDAYAIPYQLIDHRPTYTASETAASLHVHGREFAKAVALEADGRRLLAVVPAPMHVDLARMSWLAGGSHLELVPESELPSLFRGDELGAMSPVGTLYGMRVILDVRLAENELITFNAGSHWQAIRMRLMDFLRLARPMIADVAIAPEHLDELAWASVS